MLILIRKTRLKNGKVIDQSDSELSTNRVRVGSGNHCDIQLFGDDIATNHSDITVIDEGHLKVTCRANANLSIDGKKLKQATVTLGNWIDIGSHKIALIPPPPGFDASIQVNIDADSQPSVQTRYKHELRLKLPSSRLWSYVLSFVILVIALIFPLLHYLQPDTAKTLQSFGAPSDQIWSSGPLSSPHHLSGLVDNCNSCHTKGFQKVDTATCLSCHADTHSHFPANHPFTSGTDSCQACHKEHNEPQMLIVQDNKLCIDCHKTPISKIDVSGNTMGEMDAATLFSAGQHPHFMPTLLQEKAGEWTKNKALSTQEIREESNLKFPHELHLNIEKVGKKIPDSPQKEALICGDCHTAAPDGEHFLPIIMEANCASCHSLDFDDANPQRNLPHAAAEIVRTYLHEFYISQAAQQRYSKPQESARRVPGRDTSARCKNQDPLQCGGVWANEEIERLFSKGGCVDCHEAYQEEDANGDKQWQVKEVKLNTDWFPTARFSHAAHHIMSADNMGKESCASCHDAATSKLSSDVLMPKMGVCLDCHEEGKKDTAKDNIKLQCIACHAFHNFALPTMTAPAMGDGK
jgi:predicted CXXCH cytochrome family protein